jgi:hypothetical protein
MGLELRVELIGRQVSDMANPIGRPKLDPTVPRTWSEQQQVLIELLADFNSPLTKKEKSEAAGYCPTHVFELQKLPEFRLAVLEAARRNVGVSLPDIYSKLVNLALYAKDPRVNLRAVEVVLECTGELRRNAVAIQNVVAGGSITSEFQGMGRDALLEVLKAEVGALESLGVEAVETVTEESGAEEEAKGDEGIDKSKLDR